MTGEVVRCLAVKSGEMVGFEGSEPSSFHFHFFCCVFDLVYFEVREPTGFELALFLLFFVREPTGFERTLFLLSALCFFSILFANLQVSIALCFCLYFFTEYQRRQLVREPTGSKFRTLQPRCFSFGSLFVWFSVPFPLRPSISNDQCALVHTRVPHPRSTPALHTCVPHPRSTPSRPLALTR